MSKIIRDPIHGDIKIEGIFLDFLEAPEIQRLYNIKQLGFAHLVFPGGHHTRFEHSLGTYFMAVKACEILELNDAQKELVSCAALLHDIGHGPFSHTLESILRNALNVDHVDLTEKLILGEHTIFDDDEKKIIQPVTVFDILNNHGVDHHKIIDIIKGNGKDYLSQFLNSPVDVDQLDYLMRDAYYTGVAYGLIDAERFLTSLTVVNGVLGISKKGVSVVENILMARTLMYSSVYFHKTVRIAELMLSKAIELSKDSHPFEFFKMTDDELIDNLKKMGVFQHEIAVRLKYRKLFKQAYAPSIVELSKDHIDFIKKFDDFKFRRQKEVEFENKLGIPEGHVIIDFPNTELHLNEPRIDKTGIVVFDNNTCKSLDDFTPISRAIRSRLITDWAVMIITDDKHRSIVSENAEKILFD
jgi:HD superfamily phosphohydrolase